MTTLREYLDKTDCKEELKELIELISVQAVAIREAFIKNQSYADTENASGEQQAALDVWADNHITEVLKNSKLVKELASEEKDEILKFPDAKAEYAVVMDPLDGSSLIQVNLCVGTIIGIYDNGSALNCGKDLKAAMYMLYGPMTVLTITVGDGVYTFALDEETYQMLEGPVKIPEGKIYGSGALKREWTKEHEKFITEIEEQGGKLRYSGSFVADFHQILKYGGVYCYPATVKNEKGKLRLVFEANPIGFIAKQAGGAISDGKRDLLSVKPEEPHHKTPIYVGSQGIIERLEEIMK
ncbi:fructose-1,6-bisphosphatase [Methanoplanus sp. FWC-SCC4]|uniref:Fructose-1,6-bisphosphatase class 1 n=1 Tax=Methanochimaera problematica TaxID=2609417 RepID=A0AA97FBL0_9EURY|nr:class 1 fructose-bisphosphatase [Methanoplanus sp. FWC-SCC4]WOF16072.1 fructose-1,6-bisphosphatase [Methanoplanus sp. FWC-SCC4]